MQCTTYAEKIFFELIQLQTMLFCVMGDNSGHDRRLSKAHHEQMEKTRSVIWEQMKGSLPPGSNPEDHIKFEGQDPAIVNAAYTSYLTDTLGEMVLSRAVDCYHWYLRQVIFLILTKDPSALRPWAKKLGITDAMQIADFEQGTNREAILTGWFRGREARSRKLVHDHWKIVLGDDLGALVKVRNCIVHQLGEDADGSLEQLLQKFPRLCLGAKKHRISVGFAGGDAAIHVAISDLSIIDQCLAHAFSLPTRQHQAPKVTRIYG